MSCQLPWITCGKWMIFMFQFQKTLILDQTMPVSNGLTPTTSGHSSLCWHEVLGLLHTTTSIFWNRSKYVPCQIPQYNWFTMTSQLMTRRQGVLRGWWNPSLTSQGTSKSTEIKQDIWGWKGFSHRSFAIWEVMAIMTILVVKDMDDCSHKTLRWYTNRWHQTEHHRTWAWDPAAVHNNWSSWLASWCDIACNIKEVFLFPSFPQTVVWSFSLELCLLAISWHFQAALEWQRMYPPVQLRDSWNLHWTRQMASKANSPSIALNLFHLG